jgi:phosphatidylglycerophosphate synthase
MKPAKVAPLSHPSARRSAPSSRHSSDRVERIRYSDTQAMWGRDPRAKLQEDALSAITLRLVPLRYLAPRRRRAEVVPLAVVYAMTVGRLALAVLAVIAVLNGLPWTAFGLIVAFVIIDIYDGVVARAYEMETGLRRGLDGTVDKISIHLVAAFICTTLPGGVWIWLAVLVRDLIQAAVGLVVLRRLRVVAAGAKWHRAFTLLIALWGAAAIVTASTVWALAAPMLLIGLLTLVDYTRQCRLLLRAGRLPSRFALEADSL